MEKKVSVEKYPKSAFNFQCLSECHEARSAVLHPIDLLTITDIKPFCAIKGYKEYDPITGETNYINKDYCELDPNSNQTSNNKHAQNKSINFLSPLIEFDYEQFLYICYDIANFEDGLNWCDENNFVPFNTKFRIIKCIINAYGKSVDMVDQRFVLFFIEIIKKLYTVEIYKNIYQYIDFNDNIVSFKKNSKNINDHSVERINFFVRTFLTENEIYKFTYQYFKNYKEKWNDVQEHFSNIIIEFINYCNYKINLSQ